MKNKIFILVLTVLLVVTLAACEKQYQPDPAVEEYLNTGLTAEKAFNKIAKANYTSTLSVQNKNGQAQGSQTGSVSFDVSDKENLSLTIINTYAGSSVVDGVTEQTVTLVKKDGKYVYKTVANVQSKNSETEVDDDFALDLITALVYTDNGAFNDGGLYYGDIFMLKIYKYPSESFYVDTQADLCVFDEKMRIIRDDMDDVLLYQTTKINSFGLLVYDYEKFESSTQDYVMISEVSVEYQYAE